MKVILTGSTGFIGAGVLQSCIANPSITSIVALTRRPLEINNSKLHNIIQKDFLNYDKEVLDQLKGAEACVWYESTTSTFDQLTETDRGAS